eukprot:11145-Amphidinium_carterae.1
MSSFSEPELAVGHQNSATKAESQISSMLLDAGYFECEFCHTHTHTELGDGACLSRSPGELLSLHARDGSCGRDRFQSWASDPFPVGV